MIASALRQQSTDQARCSCASARPHAKVRELAIQLPLFSELDRMRSSQFRQFIRTGILVSLIILSASILCIRDAQAQDLDKVTISGKVTDQNGAVIPNASVTAKLIATGVERTVVADGDGRYRIIQLEPGIYTVKVSFANFATEIGRAHV